jgi:hypothetical protein
MNLQEIATVTGFSKQYVHQEIKRLGFKTPRYPLYGRDVDTLCIKELLEEKLKTSHSVTEISDSLNIKRNVIKSWMRFHGLSKSLLIRRKGSAHHSWKNGYFVDKKGYVWTNADSQGYREFNPQWKCHNVAVHKVVMEMVMLQCKMPSGYIIHHIDMNTQNNEPTNLALLTMGQHMKIHSLIKKAQKKYGNFKYDQNYFMIEEVIKTVDSRILELTRTLSAANITTVKLLNHIELDSNVLEVKSILECNASDLILDN